MQFPITIGLCRSRIMGAGLWLIAALAIGALLAWPQSLVVRFIGATLVPLAVWFIRRQLLFVFDAIKLERTGLVFVRFPGETDLHEVTVLSGAVVHPWLTVARLQDESGKHHVLTISADMLAQDDFRRLRVFLRWRVKFNGELNDA